MPVIFPPAIPGLEMAAPILWAPGMSWFFLLTKPPIGLATPKIVDVRTKKCIFLWPRDEEKLFDPRSCWRKGQECPQEIRTEMSMFMLRSFFAPPFMRNRRSQLSAISHGFPPESCRLSIHFGRFAVIFNHFQSVSISFSQFVCHFHSLTRSETQAFIDTGRWGKKHLMFMQQIIRGRFLYTPTPPTPEYTLVGVGGVYKRGGGV